MQTFTQLTVFLILVILLARAAVLLSNRFDLSSVPIQLLVGILLGPSLLNLLGAPIVLGTWGSISPNLLHSVLKILAEIGLIQLMFLAGLQTDWRRWKTDLKLIFSLSGWSFVLTAVGILIVVRWFVDRWTEAFAVSAIMAAVSFGISVYNFNEMKLLGSRAANIVLGAAALSGLLAILLMIASQATHYALLYGAFKMTVAVSWFVGKLIMFFAIAYFLTSRFLNRIAKTGFEKRPRQTLIGYLLLVAALYAWAAMHFGSFAAVGVASLGGGLLGMSNIGLKEKIAGGLGSALTSLPVGVLVVVLGMEVNLKGIEGHILFLAVLLATVVGTKLIGGRIAARKVFESSSERALIMFRALPQGEMGMLIGAYLFSRGLINPSQFNLTIIVVVMLTILTPVLMKIGVKLSLRGVPQCGTTKQSQKIASRSLS
jgi:Kef-type K+ transport system membrane component KefB